MTSRKIKILFTIPNFITAGSGREMMNIIEGLDKNIFEPSICVEKEGGILFEEAKSKGYTLLVRRFIISDSKGIIHLITEARRLAKELKEYHFDIWQSFNWSSDYSEPLIARLAGVKYVYVKKNMNWNRLAWKVKSLLSNKIIARNTTMLFTFLKPPYLNSKTFFIPGGVDVNTFYHTGNRSYRAKLNIKESTFLIACVAQLVRTKDQQTLIKVLAEIPDSYLVLAGAQRDPQYFNELIDLVRKLQIEERVKFIGPVDNVNDLLNACDVFVLPTTNIGRHEEGCPVALLEAMAAGIPCVASNVAGNRDLITTNETGLLFAPGNVQELVMCIRKYMLDTASRTKHVINAVKKIQSEYTLELEVELFAKMYQKLKPIR